MNQERSKTMRLIKSIMQQIQQLKELFASAIDSVQPEQLIRANVKYKWSTLHVVNRSVKLQKPCYVVGFGKAVYGMAAELTDILGKDLHSGILSIPLSSRQAHEMSKSGKRKTEHKLFLEKFKCYEGAKDNVSDEAAVKGAKEIENLCKSLSEDDVLIVLISGGGSALLPAPIEGMTLQGKQMLVKLLFSKGATINEVNCVRKQLSSLKGGQLAKVAYPARVISLILSDVIGDPLDVISSGPTVMNSETWENAIGVLEKYKLTHEIPDCVRERLCKARDDKDVPDVFHHVDNFIIGSNAIACKATKEEAEHLGYESLIISCQISGRVEKVAQHYFEIVQFFKNNEATWEDLCHMPFMHDDILDKLVTLKSLKKPVCLIFGGEPTIVTNIKKNARGGRNLHLALEFATLIGDLQGVYFLSCGTDGIDGPTDAAGAVAPVGLQSDELAAAKSYLERYDSYNYFKTYKKGSHLVVTGHTGTNVMDIHVLLIYM